MIYSKRKFTEITTINMFFAHVNWTGFYPVFHLMNHKM